MPSFTTDSPSQTKKLAGRLAKQLIQNHHTSTIISLSGEMGSGKTTFVQGFAQGLNIKDKVLSPSFILMRIHKIPGSPKKLIHIDLYRLEKINSLEDLGLKDLFHDPNNFLMIEWPEKVSHLLPKNIVKITLEKISSNQRGIELSPGSLSLS